MRKETKIGIIIGIIIVAGVAVYFVNQDKGQRARTPDNFSMDELDKTASGTSTAKPVSPAKPTLPPKTTANSSKSTIKLPEGTENKVEPAKTEPLTPVKNDEAKTAASDNRTDVKISLPTKTAEPVKAEPIVTKAVKDNDPLANLPESYPEQITETKYHVIKKGDSLYSISTEYFGTGKYWKAIFDKNKDVIKNESSLTVGWKIKIPTPEEIE